MQIMLVGIGTILAIVFIVQINKGKKYEQYVINLDSNVFPMAELYTVGFSWSNTKIFEFKGELASNLKKQSTLLYGVQYADYYANVFWAQTITFVHLFLSVTFLIAGIMVDLSLFMLVVGIFFSVVMGMYCMEYMKNELSKRTEECEYQFPEVISTMAILVNSGMMLRDAWSMVAANGNGAIYDLMKKVTENMKNGYSDADAIYLFGRESNSTEIKKFTSALLQNMEKGGGELTSFLAQQSSELWNAKRQRMLQEGEKASTKLLLPIVLIFVGIIIIVMTAAFAGSLF